MTVLDLSLNTEAFFSSLIEQAVSRQELELSEEVRLYLIKLLVLNASSGGVMEQSTKLLDETPLSIVYLEAMNEPSSLKRIKFKFIADYSLYLLGFFGDSLNGKIIDPACYIMLGTNCFANLSSITRDAKTSYLYSQMLYSFPDLVEVLTEVSFDTMVSSSQDLMRLYKRWLRTGSKVLERKLMEKGMISPGTTKA